jgi:uncharacterized protein YqjF (DUF2071 family)
MNQWIIQQTWRNVLFLNYRVDPALVQSLVPFELDLFENQAILSIVPFRMTNIRFPYLPEAPLLSSLWELNLRTYVTHNGIKGVYFFTLDTDHRVGQLIASRFFKLPYRYAKISACVSDREYHFKSSRGLYQVHLDAHLERETKPASKLDLWSTERYSLFQRLDDNTVIQGIVHHEPWQLEKASIINLNQTFIDQLGFSITAAPDEVSYSHELRVRFSKFKHYQTESCP